ncbi:MAG: heme-degrading domain-containing protein [Devosia sp.]
MDKAEDIRRIVAQEEALVFHQFDEHVAFEIGLAARRIAVSQQQGVVIDVRSWDRPLFYCALAGTSGDNQHWVRRKANTVQRFAKSTYRMVLEKSWEGDVFPPRRALDPDDYVLAGGGFPIRLANAGVIGAAIISGLPEREDHKLIVAAIAQVLGKDISAIALD